MSEQPMPTPGRDDVSPVVLERFQADLLERDRRGRETYGTPLQTHNGRDAGQDAWEELIDLAQYLTQLRMEHADALAEIARLESDLDAVEQQRDELQQALQCLVGTP